MRLSRYIYIHNIDENEVMVYSLISQKIISMDKESYENIKNGIIDLSEEEIVLLKDIGIIVSDDKQAEEFIKMKTQGTVGNLKILVTESCNLNCVYCYEKNYNSIVEELDVEKIIDFIRKFIYQKKLNEIKINLYGGEPLIAADKIIAIMEKINCEFNDKIKVKYSMITNGTLLDKVDLKTMIDLGLKNISVSVDGAQKINDIRRPFHNNRGTYQKIMNNIEKVIKSYDLNICLASVIDKQNYATYGILLKDLEERGLKEKVILNIVPCKELVEGNNHINNYGFKTQDEMAEIMGEVTKIIRKQKFRHTNVLAIPDAVCKQMKENHYTINLKGDLFLCPGVIGIDHFKFGNILDQDFPVKPVEVMSEKCIKCKYMPICSGGCRYEAYISKRKGLKVTCNKEYLDKLFAKIIPLLY